MCKFPLQDMLAVTRNEEKKLQKQGFNSGNGFDQNSLKENFYMFLLNLSYNCAVS